MNKKRRMGMYIKQTYKVYIVSMVIHCMWHRGYILCMLPYNQPLFLSYMVTIKRHGLIYNSAGLTKPGEVGEILTLYWLKSPSFDPKAKLVTLFLFASHSFLASNLHFMVKLIDKAIVINGKYIRIRGKCFIQAIKKV